MPRTKQAISRKKASADNGSHTQPSPTGFEQIPAIYEEEVRRRAYEIYEARGRQEGLAEQDWIRAEQEVLQHSEKRTA